MRLVVISGMPTCPIRRLVTQTKAARGTIVAMVGMRASCQPMPVLMIVAPAASTALARVTISSQVLPPSTRSSIDRRKMMMKFSRSPRAHAAHRFECEAAAVLETAAPAVLAEIGLLGDELVDQITFRSHHLDAVIAGELGEPAQRA
jgi:hypothetical protein